MGRHFMVQQFEGFVEGGRGVIIFCVWIINTGWIHDRLQVYRFMILIF